VVTISPLRRAGDTGVGKPLCRRLPIVHGLDAQQRQQHDRAEQVQRDDRGEQLPGHGQRAEGALQADPDQRAAGHHALSVAWSPSPGSEGTGAAAGGAARSRSHRPR
jgi:hypothetical protein